MIDVIAWGLIVTLPLNAYFLYHGWTLNRAVHPRSPLLRSMLWVKFSIFLSNVFLAFVAYRYLNQIEPTAPFGGIGFGIVLLFILSIPAVVHVQMLRVVRYDEEQDQARHDIRDLARDEGRDPIRDEARDIARDTEHDANGGP